jgi:hypothetical protein
MLSQLKRAAESYHRAVFEGVQMSWAEELAQQRKERASDLRWHRRFWWFFALIRLVFLLGSLGVVGLMLYVFVMGSFSDLTATLLMGALALSVVGVFAFALVRNLLLRRDVYRFASKLEGARSFSGAAASTAELTWLDTHGFGHAPRFSPFLALMYKYVTIGTYRGHPVMLTGAIRIRERRRDCKLAVLHLAKPPAPDQIGTHVPVAEYLGEFHARRAGTSVAVHHTHPRAMADFTDSLDELF